MKILNFGSLNIDHVYDVKQFVRPGETIASKSYQQHCGGKGLNQSIAAAHAGATVQHYGKIGSEGKHLLKKLSDAGVDTSLVNIVPGPTGHAIIQVSAEGENSIIIEGGANQTMNNGDIDKVFANLSEGDWLLLQNEINNIGGILEAAKKNSCRVVLNPAPMTADIRSLPLEILEVIILNEIEGLDLTGETKPIKIITSLLKRYPDTRIVLTLGAQGAIYADHTKQLNQPGFEVNPVDTTAAGDTFVGYFIASLCSGKTEAAALYNACRAAAICVTRKGAAEAIPRRGDIPFFQEIS